MTPNAKVAARAERRAGSDGSKQRYMMEVSSSNKVRKSRVLVLYTGGTIGMKKMDSGKN